MKYLRRKNTFIILQMKYLFQIANYFNRMNVDN